MMIRLVKPRSTLLSTGRIAGWVAAGLLMILFALWCIPAVYYSNLPWQWLRTTLACALPIAIIASFIFFRNRLRTAFGVVVTYLVIWIWWMLIPASNDRDWAPEYGRLPSVEINDDKVTIKNIRNFDYRSTTDYTVRYYDKTFDLNQLKTINFMTVFWNDNKAIAHTMLSFGFSDGSYVCFSVETRREKGETYSTIAGFFKQFELIYVIGDERDLIRLRTNYRDEQVFLYSTTSNPDEAKVVFLDLLRKANDLNDNPKFYNTLTTNCTTTLAPSVRKVRPPRAFDIRLLANGFSDEMAYENGWIDSKVKPFEKMKQEHHINAIAKALPDDDHFSKNLREQLKKQLSDPPENFQ